MLTLRFGLCCALLTMTAQHAAAQRTGVVIEFDPAPRLRAGEVGAVRVRVRIEGGADQPLLLTPSVEGQALSVVRGRLLRDDATELAPSELRFEVPVTARVPGTALLRVELSTYRCSSARCEPLRGWASLPVRVETAARRPPIVTN